MAKSHGYYLQHAKEVCLVGKKGSDPPGIRKCVGSDVIYSERRGQSQKPEEIYQLIEELVPNGKMLSICQSEHHNECMTNELCYMPGMHFGPAAIYARLHILTVWQL